MRKRRIIDSGGFQKREEQNKSSFFMKPYVVNTFFVGCRFCLYFFFKGYVLMLFWSRDESKTQNHLDDDSVTKEIIKNNY